MLKYRPRFLRGFFIQKSQTYCYSVDLVYSLALYGQDAERTARFPTDTSGFYAPQVYGQSLPDSTFRALVAPLCSFLAFS